MSTRPPSLGLVADRRIREDAAQKAPQLDVRGPISQAMQRAGVSVPPDSSAPPSSAPLSGLTTDERRVHQILLDALAMTAQQGLGDGTGISMLSYAEKKHLPVLDLEFIDAELAKMGRPGEFQSGAARWTLGIGGALVSFGLTLAFLRGGNPTGVLLIGGGMVLIVALVAVVAGASGYRIHSPQRKKIYEALRELALVAHPDVPVSEALVNADRVIDRLALDSLNDEAPASSFAPRQRVRS